MTETFASHLEARIALLRRAIAIKPESADLLFALADALADRGEYDEFACNFQRAYRLHPWTLPRVEEWPPETPKIEFSAEHIVTLHAIGSRRGL
jgi:tetratricopeptide (TPR) repeat protein